jgi:folate-binding protein YgfZ
MSANEDRAKSARRLGEAVLAVRAAHRTGVLVRGKDRTSWLNGLVTCDLAKLGPGDAAYGLVVEKKGRIQTDLFAIPAAAAAPVLALSVPCALRDAILETLDHHLVMEDVELEAAELDTWILHGPKAKDVTARLAAPYAGSVDLLGVGGAAVAAPSEESEGFLARLTSIVGEVGGAVIDDAEWEPLRIERGLPRFGVEVDATLYPQEASLEKLAVSFDKGCYLGQEVVYMLENRGHAKRRLVPLEIEGDTPVAVGAPVATVEGAAVGEVKSSVMGPASGKPAAIAMVKWVHAKAGTELRVAGRVARVRGG